MRKCRRDLCPECAAERSRNGWASCEEAAFWRRTFDRKWRYRAMLKKRAAIEADLRGTTSGAVDQVAEQLYPTLLAFLTRVTWEEDGSPRIPGTILFFTEGAAFKARLCDKDDPAVAFVTSGSLDGLLAAIEAGLASGGLDWRPDRPPSTGRRPGR